MKVHERAVRVMGPRATDGPATLVGDQKHVALARERRRELQAAMVALEQAAAGPGNNDRTWRGLVGARFEGLAHAFADHVEAVEDGEGLFHEILDREPRLMHRVDLLRADHEATADEITALREALGSSAQTPRELLEPILALTARVTRHLRAGADLVWEAYGIDIGSAE